MFQFTRPRGARQSSGYATASMLSVSIHAPTRGATNNQPCNGNQERFQFTRPRGARRISRRCNAIRVCFNSRAHEGRDSKASDMRLMKRFQFTRPRGARLYLPGVCSSATSFNSRAHEGRDQPFPIHTCRVLVSIHAPTRGATNCICLSPPCNAFQFTRPRGARRSDLE